MSSLKVAICQTSPRVGDFAYNINHLNEHYKKACNMGADIAMFAEASICGYYAYDLLLKPSFIEQCQTSLQDLAQLTKDKTTSIIIGCPTVNINSGKSFNSVCVLADGIITNQRHKQFLADEDVCIDTRYFDNAENQNIVEINNIKIGLPICNDIWVPEICYSMKQQGAEILLSINASPFYFGKHNQRTDIVKMRTKETNLPMIYVNDTGGYDGILSEGLSFGINANGDIFCQAPQFKTGVFLTTLTKKNNGDWIGTSNTLEQQKDFHETVWQACVFGLQQYVAKNNFKGVILGLSGGIDSAITCAMAVDALGTENVHTIMMPSPYTSEQSLNDARECAHLMGIKYDIVNIEPMMLAFECALKPLMGHTQKDTTEENIQARIRGDIVMAMSNKFGYLALTTGNKSENAVGYSTLYGDMCGGFNLIKDIYKSDIFEICKWRNKINLVMPDNVITKSPTAELRKNQTDQDSLPEYDILDGILKLMIEGDLSIAEIVTTGYEQDTVEKIWLLVHLAEYKRGQSAPGLKLTSRDLKYNRIYPISNGYTQFALNKEDKND